MACPTPSLRYVVHALLSFAALIILTPFIVLYSRRYEKNLCKNHYKPIEDHELRLAKQQFEDIGAQARKLGLAVCGCFVQAPGTGSGRDELQLWLNDRRDVLVIAIVRRVWLLPKLWEVRVVSHLGGGRTLVTVSATAMLNDVSGLEDAHLCPADFTLAQLLSKHEWRLAEVQSEPLPFSDEDPIGDYEDLHWHRVQKLAEQGYATIIDHETTQWRYTSAGEAALACRNRLCNQSESA